jgi:hypothetical protein
MTHVGSVQRPSNLLRPSGSPSAASEEGRLYPAPVLLNTVDVYGTSGMSVFKVVTGAELTWVLCGTRFATTTMRLLSYTTTRRSRLEGPRSGEIGAQRCNGCHVQTTLSTFT